MCVCVYVCMYTCVYMYICVIYNIYNVQRNENGQQAFHQLLYLV